MKSLQNCSKRRIQAINQPVLGQLSLQDRISYLLSSDSPERFFLFAEFVVDS